MKRFIRATSYLLAVAFFSVALSGCTKQSANTSSDKLVVWSFEPADIWTPIKESFEAKNKGYTLEYHQETLDSGYENRVLNSILSGNGPDVWSMPNDWVYRHKDKLTPRPVDGDQVELNDQFVPSIKQSVFFDNNIYALSPTAEPLVIYYNEELANQAVNEYYAAHPGDTNAEKREHVQNLFNQGIPTTWTGFAEAAQIFTKKQGNTIVRSGVAMGTDRITYGIDTLYLLMLQNQTKIFADDLNMSMVNLPVETPKATTETPGERALEFYTSFANPKNANYSWNNSLGNDIDAFAHGKVVMMFGYDELQNTLAQKYPNFSYKKTSVPQINDDYDKFVDYAKFNAFGVSNLSNNPTLAWSLVDSLATDFSGDFAAATRLYTSAKATDYSSNIADRATDNPEKNSLAKAQSLVKGRYPKEIDDLFKDAVFAVNKGAQAPQGALDLIASKITDILRKESW